MCDLNTATLEQNLSCSVLFGHLMFEINGSTARFFFEKSCEIGAIIQTQPGGYF